jgi:hypothetical protein
MDDFGNVRTGTPTADGRTTGIARAASQMITLPKSLLSHESVDEGPSSSTRFAPEPGPSIFVIREGMKLLRKLFSDEAAP